LIKYLDDLSLTDLLNLQREGFDVIRSAHASNLHGSTLALAEAGINVMLYTRMTGENDVYSHGSRIIVNQESHEISNPDKVVSAASIMQLPELPFDHPFNVGDRVVDLHNWSINKAFPNGSFIDYETYLQKNSVLLEQMILQLTEDFSNVWKNRVTEAGELVRDEFSAESYAEHGLFGLNGNKTGWSLPNHFNILLTALEGAIRTGKNVVYHLAGPAMIRYVSELVETLVQMYEQLSISISGDLTFYLVPVADMRFFAFQENQIDIVDGLLKARSLMAAFNERRGATLRQKMEQSKKEELVAEFKLEKKRMEEGFRDLANKAPWIFYDARQAKHITQYDFLTGKRSLIVPDSVMNMSMKDLIAEWKFLEGLLMGGSKKKRSNTRKKNKRKQHGLPVG
jgi:hypothetical protein